jgi:hypothetical protein
MDRELLVRNAARLRRAHRRYPDDEDIAAMRIDVERAAGATVGRAASARLLGVSQTALDRWIGLGEIPAVRTPTGRHEVPTAALLDLLDELEQRGVPARHPLAAILRKRRSVERISPSAPSPLSAPGHRAAELRGLAYHRAVAQRLDDAIVADALARLRRWRAERRIHPHYADAWEALLAGPRARLRQAILTDNDAAAALRQSSPLAGVLSDAERRQILGLPAARA